uniref:RRM domain-containing protein n=1 Tax=Ciona savignyi TaxID=51511 RepID=H2Y5S5_CIOSA
MSMKKEDYQEFQRQLDLQKQTNKGNGKTKIEDGTEYEWDEGKKAWFPKLSLDMMMKFQSQYSDTSAANTSSSYVDPVSKLKYIWDTTSHSWKPDFKYEVSPSGEYTYTDPATHTKYKWNAQEQTWVKLTDGEGGMGELPASGSSYDLCSAEYDKWKEQKEEWGEMAQDKKGGKRKQSKPAEKRAASKPEWVSVEKQKNTSVYVSNLPPDISPSEFQDIMTKYGIIATNAATGEPKLKLYVDDHGENKGDGLCTYFKRESVQLATQMLDGMDMRGHKLNAQEASFKLKGEYDASKKPKMLSKKEKQKLNKEKEKMLDWKLARSEDPLSKTDRVVILKRMFEVKEFEEEPILITEIKEDLRRECEKFGPVKKVIVFDRHPDGVCSVSFKTVEDAAKCQVGLHGRWFAGKSVEASIWDGHTDYQVEETDREREVRLQKWEAFLDGENTSKETDNSRGVDEPQNSA